MNRFVEVTMNTFIDAIMNNCYNETKVNSQSFLLFIAFLALGIMLFVFSLSASNNYYRAAVLELVQFSDLSYSPTEVAQQNLKIYETAGKAAALNVSRL